jgi:KDO2-lipid IV(A) lauroyltransferase
MPIGSKVFDRMMRKMRGKYATVLIPATDFKNHYQQWVKTPHILGSAADQSPATPTNAYWVDFFGRKTAFIRGAERGAVAINAAVVFVHFFKVKRGHYRMVTKFITDDAAKLDNGKFVQSYAHFVEEAIKMKPANYLWSHRRWKHEWKPEYQHLTL